MFALTIPLLGFGALLLIAVVRCRGNLFHPSAVLCAAYAVMSASSVVYGVIKETWLSFPDDAANSSTLLLLLLSASLAPSFIIKRPDLSMDSMKRCFGGMIFGLAAIVGIVGFVCLLPTFLITTSLDAYAVKQLGQGALAEAGSYLTVGVVVSALSGVFGLLVFWDTTFELNWIVRIGLLLGLMNYALIMECNKSRDWPVYYLFYFLLYFWLFRDKWRRTMRKFYFTFILCILGSGVVMFTHKTIQR
ncbi:MAG: hypothetical protein NT154_16625, partial [Verrucomicrobia bacterium]|nr:hypothetical protein [Verrucomicrobiota bacterium]